MRRILTGLVLILMLTGGAGAGPLQEGHAAYERGDYSEAARWCRLGAEQGDHKAQFMLGGLYANGKGVPQDHAEAAKWWSLAAEQGAAPAQNNLASAYALGEGVPQDYVLAHMWYNLASSRFPASAGNWRSSAARLRDLTAARMTPAQIAEAQKLAREWKPK